MKPSREVRYSYGFSRAGRADPDRRDTGDAKYAPSKDEPSKDELRIFERREQAALKECLRQRKNRHESSTDGKMARLEQTLAKLEEQNRTRSDNINGRLDQVIRKLR